MERLCVTRGSRKKMYTNVHGSTLHLSAGIVLIAVMRKSERWRCKDAMVVRGAMCNMDHMMLRLKVRID